MSNKPYFATLPIDKIGIELQRRVDDYYNWLRTNGVFASLSRQVFQWQKSSVHGSSIPKVGNSAEYDALYTNHFRTVGERIINDVTSQKPIFKCRAGNTDASTQQQAKLGNVILDHYYRETNLDSVFRECGEYSFFINEGFVYCPWRHNAGNIIGYKPLKKDYSQPLLDENDNQVLDEDGSPISEDYQEGDIYDLPDDQDIDYDNWTPVFDGDIQPYILGILDVCRDFTSPRWDYCNWVDVRTYVNKYELAKQYPEFKEKIIAYLPAENDRNFRYVKGRSDNDYIPLREFYHKNDSLVPGGLFVKWLTSDIILEMAALPYKEIPLARQVEAEMKDLPFGYTRASDMVPPQIAYDRLNTILFSNQSTFGSQTIVVDEGSEPEYKEIADGMNTISTKPGFKDPRVLEKLHSAPEIPPNRDTQYQNLLLTAGINETMMGNPGSDVQTARGQMLQHTIYMKNSTPIQNAYSKLITRVANLYLSILQQYADSDRWAKIVGKNDDYMLKEWNKDSIANISTVIVELGSPNLGTPGYILEVADTIMQHGYQIDPNKLAQSIQNVNLDFLTESTDNTEILISSENEKLAEGEDVICSMYDIHPDHIQGHNNKISDPEIRNNPRALAAHTRHILQHNENYKNADPAILAILGIPPYPAPPPPLPEPPVSIDSVPHVVVKTMGASEEDKQEMPQNVITKKTTIQ